MHFFLKILTLVCSCKGLLGIFPVRRPSCGHRIFFSRLLPSGGHGAEPPGSAEVASSGKRGPCCLELGQPGNKHMASSQVTSLTICFLLSSATITYCHQQCRFSDTKMHQRVHRVHLEAKKTHTNQHCYYFSAFVPVISLM